MKKTLIFLPIFFLLLGAGCGKGTKTPTNNSLGNETVTPVVVGKSESKETKTKLVAADQSMDNKKIIITEVSTEEPRWVVVYADGQGRPGAILGNVLVPAGTSKNVEVNIDDSAITPQLFAILHDDTNTLGTFEFPDADMPTAETNEKVVVVTFAVLNAPNLPE